MCNGHTLFLHEQILPLRARFCVGATEEANKERGKEWDGDNLKLLIIAYCQVNERYTGML